MNYEIVSDESIDKKSYEVQRINNDDIQIAEIYDTRNKNLDFVVMYFKFNSSTSVEVEKRISEYRKKGELCIIGCINSLEEIIDFTNDSEYSVFKNLTSLFDIHLDAAVDFDFENLIDFCISTEDAIVHISQHDFKSQTGTEVIVVSDQNNSIEKLIERLKISTQKLLEHRSIKKFPKVVISLMTNGRELMLNEAKEIMDSLTAFLVEDAQCMWNSCECTEKLKDNEVKVTVIYFEKK